MVIILQLYHDNYFATISTKCSSYNYLVAIQGFERGINTQHLQAYFAQTTDNWA